MQALQTRSPLISSHTETSWDAYYQKVRSRPHRPLTEFAAAANISSLQVAVDCGCGTGSDMAYLAGLGYRVHAFDQDPGAVQICTDRFRRDSGISISHDAFEDYTFPESGLVVANLSLFFCNPADFKSVWRRMTESLSAGGVFSGDLLGPKDSWLGNRSRPFTVLTKTEVAELFNQFEILKWKETDELGKTAVGDTKHWHVFTVVARKRAD